MQACAAVPVPVEAGDGPVGLPVRDPLLLPGVPVAGRPGPGQSLFLALGAPDVASSTW